LQFFGHFQGFWRRRRIRPTCEASPQFPFVDLPKPRMVVRVFRIEAEAPILVAVFLEHIEQAKHWTIFKGA
jgi:hypothetical protein